MLGGLGLVLAVAGFRRALRMDDNDHDAVAYLKTGVVGALFTLSPPVSMLVFSSTVLPDHGVGVVLDEMGRL
ncbi:MULTISPECIES: hypothetical protein [unclassified Haloferax]|uniref:hypothetical protein n=1 Tax=unclassified Haloferax TaxID=2625095 RepID=UPI00067820A1|nr:MULTISPECIES: hypothetical protein [unclassified Haloferax]